MSNQVTIPQAMDLARRLLHGGQLDQAESLYRQIIAASDGSPDAHNDLGMILMLRREIPQAIDEFQTALRLQPDYVQACNNLGIALGRLGRYDQAIAAHERAIQLQPDWAPPHVNLAMLLLLKGDFLRGFAEHEWRLKVEGLRTRPPQFAQPMWDGAPLEGRRILIHPEQGFGDVIQFVRYIPLVAGRGGQVILSCPPELLRLLRQIPGVAQFVTHGDPLPQFDVHRPLLSLPRVLGTTVETIPSQISYLSADEELAVRWRKKIDELPPGVKVGLAWAGRATHGADLDRSIEPAAFESLRGVGGVHFVSLQKSPAPQMGIPVVDWTSELTDFAETAALIHELDGVITVDTAVAHLAGAMGTPTWVLLPCVPDWRWMLERPDSPWYPTIRLLRQPAAGDWRPPIQRIAAELLIFKR